MFCNNILKFAVCCYCKISFKIFTCFLVLIYFTNVSCNSKKRDYTLEDVLNSAGSNRIELEQVLAYYKDDSLKLEAAKFLIKNMLFHYSYGNLNEYYKSISPLISIATVEILDSVKNELDITTNNYLDKIILLRDIEHIKSSFLISHIDQAFLTREYPWNKDVSFVDFCKYVLPYRIKEEAIENWMPIYKDYSKHVADSIYKESSSYKDFITQLYDYFNKNTPYINTYSFKIKNTPSSLIGIRYGTCEEIAMLGVYLFRSLGIPIYYDFTPNWANRSLNHDWNGININETYYPFILQAEEDFGTHLTNKSYEKYGKIYRRTYSIQDESLFMEFKNYKNEKRPPFLAHPYLKDISYLYKNNTITKKIKLSNKTRNPYLYISIFDNKDWTPIGWCKKYGDKTLIKDLYKGCCYLMTTYDKNILKPLTYPFIINNDGTLKTLFPNKDSIQTLILKRKYPTFAMERYSERSVGGEFHGSNCRKFTDYELLYTVNHTLIDMKWQTINFSPSKKFKYIRYYSAKGGYNNIAEIKIFSEKHTPIKGKIIAEGEFLNSKAGLKENAFDENPLTFFASNHPDSSWVGLEFNEKKNIHHISYLFRNDDNNVKKGDIYELLYWDNKWISLGEKRGTCDSLIFTNCPINALFLLRNHTEGTEERIFTWERNKQVWW